MSQSFKLKFNQMREGNPTNVETPVEHRDRAFEEFYSEESHARNICFVWLDGRRLFMNYSYLISGEFLPAENKITLTFTTHVIFLKGVNLQGLFYDIMNLLIKQVTCVDERYNLIGEQENFVVNNIQLEQRP